MQWGEMIRSEERGMDGKKWRKTIGAKEEGENRRKGRVGNRTRKKNRKGVGEREGEVEDGRKRVRQGSGIRRRERG